MSDAEDGKVCTKCGEWKAISDFHKKASNRDGHSTRCKACAKILNAESYAKDGSAKRNVAQKARRMAKPEQRKVWDAVYRALHPERVAESARKTKMRPEYIVARKLSIAAWAKANPEKRKAIEARSVAKQKERPDFRINANVSRAIRASFSAGVKGGRATFTLLGYSKADLMARLESTWSNGMSWENYGRDGWHIDHIIPKSLFKFSSPSDHGFREAWALTNLQALWAHDNHVKYNKVLVPDNDNLEEAGRVAA